MMQYNYLNGLRIVENSNMTVLGKPYDVKRTWTERLFTWPWNPFKSSKTIVTHVPSNEVIQGDGVLIMHPEIAKVFKESMNNESE